MTNPHVTVIVPTYQRRELVKMLLLGLAQQQYEGDFDVVVVVDGSSDGTAEAIREVERDFPLRVIEHSNHGLAYTRNRGAAAARGEILLFLDDDMEPDPNLLAQHARSHQEGAEVVLGAMPLHPGSPDNLISNGVRIWAGEVAERWSAPGYELRFDDIYGGQMSVRRSVFHALGGYDERFTRAGSYGNEDLDLGYRLLAAGHRVTWNPRAISQQRYVVDAAAHLRQYRQAGHADVALVRKHPELAERTFADKRQESEIHRTLWRPVLAMPTLWRWLMPPLRRLAVRRVDSGCQDRWTTWSFFAVRAIEYWMGVHEAGGIPRPRPMRVLAYHAISDLEGDPVLEPWGTPANVFAEQLDAALRAGYRFVEPEEFLRLMEGLAGVPRRSLLLTFDDCYQDLLTAALPLLKERNIPAVAFAVTGQIGGSNEWDQAVGARRQELLDRRGLERLASEGVEIAAHSRTHRPLASLDPDELATEIGQSLEDLEAIGLGGLRLFAYPHGVYDDEVRRAAAAAGARAAFTVDPGRARRGQDLMSIPRIQILRHHVGWQFRVRVALAGRSLALRAGLRRVARSLGMGRRRLSPDSQSAP